MYFYLQTFQKYLSFKKDTTELLYYILRQMTLDQITYIRGIHGVDVNVIEIHEKDFLDKVIQNKYSFTHVNSLVLLCVRCVLNTETCSAVSHLYCLFNFCLIKYISYDNHIIHIFFFIHPKTDKST